MNTKFQSIASTHLDRVTGGSARVSASSRGSDLDSKLQLMLTQIGDSIKDVANQKPNSMDQFMPIMMMMMMGGGGGGGAAAAPPPPAPVQPNIIKVRVGR